MAVSIWVIMKFSLTTFPSILRVVSIHPVDDKEWIQVVHWEKDRIDSCGYVQHVSYVLTWGNPDPNPAQALSDCYKLIHDQGRLKLYREHKNQYVFLHVYFS